MNKITLIFLTLMLPLLVVAQLPLLDITLEAKETKAIQVKIRPDQSFNGLVSNVQFTIKWAATDDVHLGEPVFNTPANLSIFPQKAGDEVEENGFRYQKFGGVGMNPLSGMNESWAAGEEILVLEIPVLNASSIESGDFVLSADLKTTETYFNGVFYAELDAQNRTGVIYNNSTATAVDPLISAHHSFDRVYPNPASESTTLEFSLVTAGEVSLTLYNDIGQVVSAKKMNGVTGSNQMNWDVSQLASGVYQIGLSHMDVVLTQKLVVIH